MFHIHIAGSGFEYYWKYSSPANEIMGKWFGQLRSRPQMAVLFVDWPGGSWLDDYCPKAKWEK